VGRANGVDVDIEAFYERVLYSLIKEKWILVVVVKLQPKVVILESS
jgi:hypothetical protein